MNLFEFEDSSNTSLANNKWFNYIQIFLLLGFRLINFIFLLDMVLKYPFCGNQIVFRWFVYYYTKVNSGKEKEEYFTIVNNIELFKIWTSLNNVVFY